MDGYGSKEISEKTGLSVNAIDLRIFKLKKKIKKFFISGKIPAFFLGYRANGEKETFALQLEK